ncbi:hypothetical protein [Halorussus litoreus]|uniref:hypothetical protein n=1 Tax=Halorussus litoreus TaxID=1710536 RepID=UPI000E27F874|nr:hypothetical protein [Halorussus litoreus]
MTGNPVYYYHPDDDQFSLDFVNPDREKIDDRLDSYEKATETRVRSYDLDETVYGIYAKTNDVDDAGEIEYGFDAAFAKMTPDTRVIVRNFLGIFRTIRDGQSETEADSLDAYKEIDIERVPDALDRVHWSGTASQVGAQLASNLVLCHALPNANHRTALSMYESYVNAVTGPTYELPSLVTDDETWHAWVDDFVVDPKRLLTVRRNVGLFGHLSQFGCDVVRRKGDVDVPLAEFELDLYPHEALSKYARIHEQRTSAFVERLRSRTNDERLTGTSGIDRGEFADAIRREIQSRR